MGFFDKITSAFNWVKDKTVGAYNWVSDKVQGVVKSGKKVVKAIHQDARDFVSGTGSLVAKTEDTYSGIVGNLVNKSADTIQSVGHDAEKAVGDVSQGLANMATPLAIAAAVIGGIYLMKK